MSSATENYVQSVIAMLIEDNNELIEMTKITDQYEPQIRNFIDGFREFAGISAELEEQIVQLVLGATIE